MQQENIQKCFWYVTLNILGMLGLSCYILADTYFIAQWLGADGLAALNLAIPVYNLISGIGLMLGMGGAARYAFQRSCGEVRQASCTFTHTVRMGAAFAALLLLTGLLGAEPLANCWEQMRKLLR